jgi:hypothetical protein
MSATGLIALAIYVIIVAVVGYVLIWLVDRFAPGELRKVLRVAIIVVIVLLILYRLVTMTVGVV